MGSNKRDHLNGRLGRISNLPMEPYEDQNQIEATVQDK